MHWEVFISMYKSEKRWSSNPPTSHQSMYNSFRLYVGTLSLYVSYMSLTESQYTPCHLSMSSCVGCSM